MTPYDAVHPLSSLFRPNSIALVGATERSFWSNITFANLQRFGFPGKIHLVNRNGGTIYKRSAAKSCAEIGEPVDLALLMVPENALPSAIEDLSSANICTAVILSSGFAEMGAQGANRQLALVAQASRNGIRFLGPNCLGFINYADRAPVWTSQRRSQKETGAVAIVSQSGAVAGVIADAAFHQALPLSYLVSTGNEADIDVADVIDFLSDDANTRVIGVFLESVRNGERFAAAAAKAFQKGKPIVVLKVGTSEQSAKAAQAHTGSLVGDDRVFDAACHRFGMVRVNSPESLVLTCSMLAKLGPIQGGLGFAAMSGGMCEIAADRAADEGVNLPTLAPSTVAALKEVLPEFSTPQNPLDITGGAMLNPELFEKAARALANDPGLGVVACVCDAPETEDPTGFMQVVFDSIGRGFQGAAKPAFVLSNITAPLTKIGREATSAAGVTYFSGGIDRGIAALARATKWWSRYTQNAQSQHPALPPFVAAAGRAISEREVLEHLAKFDVPIVPAELATSPEAAKRIAKSIGANVVLKIVSPQISHKSDVGGVALNVPPATAGDTYSAMLDRVKKACPDAAIDGILVSPMRGRGVELFVGIMRDPVWGPVLVLGLGGVLVEALKDTALRLLPVTADDVLSMFDQLRAAALLDGFRGAPAANRRATAEVVAKIGDAALALGPDLIAMDVNPLLVCGDTIEALDGLAVWRD